MPMKLHQLFFKAQNKFLWLFVIFFENWILKGRGVGNIIFYDKNDFLWFVSNCNVSNSAPLKILDLKNQPPSPL